MVNLEFVESKLFELELFCIIYMLNYLELKYNLKESNLLDIL